MKKCISVLLLLTLILSLFAACKASDQPQEDIIINPEPQKVDDKEPDASFRDSYKNLALQLFQNAAKDSQGENLLLSPLSVQLALAMTANGADGQTRQEMENLLGQGIPLEDLNLYLHTYVQSLPAEEKAKLSLANSIWMRDQKDRLTVEESFLQTNADYYGAELFSRPFDSTTAKEINNWVDQKTDGMIPEIVKKIPDESVMYLINAMAFDAEWAQPYEEYAIRDDGTFTALSGQQQTVSMMHGSEDTYLDDGRATGFVKMYSGEQYGFAVLLPNEGEDLYEYIGSLTADGITKTLRNAEYCQVITQLPKFSYDYELMMNDMLKEMGMPTVFDAEKADLSRLGQSAEGNLYVSQVLHKTFIQVDGMGTRAGAVTVVEITPESAMGSEPEHKEVIVDRPFVYMILDMENNLPLFIGCVTEITE